MFITTDFAVVVTVLGVKHSCYCSLVCKLEYFKGIFTTEKNCISTCLRLPISYWHVTRSISRHEWMAWNVNNVDFLFSVRCLCIKQYMVAWRNGISLLAGSTWYLTLSVRSLVRYRVERSKRNSVSPRAHACIILCLLV